MFNLMIKEVISGCEKVEYRFYVKEFNIFLDSKRVMRRETKLCPFELVKKESYSRLDKSMGLKEEPEIDETVQSLAISMLREKINFKRWKHV